MESFLSELESKKIISIEDITVLKQYIYKKHNNRSSYEKRQILTDAIHKVLDKSIEGIAPKYISSIKKQLLERVVTGTNQTVYMADIFTVCINSEETSEEFMQSLQNWVNLNVENKVTTGDILEYTDRNDEYIKSRTYEKKQEDIEKKIKNDSDSISKLQNIDINIPKGNPVYETLSSTIETVVLRKNRFFNHAFTAKWMNKINLKNIKTNKRLTALIAINLIAVISICILVNSLFLKTHSSVLSADNSKMLNVNKYKISTIRYSQKYVESILSNLPQNFRYKDLDTYKLRNFLNKRESLLGKEPYFSTIIDVAKEYNLNPNILFAVTGQEQGFVPKTKKHAKQIVNNPFNVYISWKKYNTDLRDSTEIACVTIINMCKDRPNETEAFRWINKNYAEDSNWHKGVRSIFNMLEKKCAQKEIK